MQQLKQQPKGAKDSYANKQWQIPAEGRLPPQAIEIENAILGVILMEGKRAFDTVIDILQSSNCFYAPKNALLWEILCEIDAKTLPIDLTTVTMHCRNNSSAEWWSPYELTKLTMDVVSSAHLEGHCRIIQEKFLARELIATCDNTMKYAYTDDIFDVLQFAEDGIFDLTVGKVGNDYQGIDQIIHRSRNEMIENRNNPKKITGVDTGIQSLNNLTGGWQKSDVIIIAARPGVGKTALALNFAKAAADSGVGVGIFSLEMSSKQLTDRLISIESRLPLSLIKKRDLTNDQLETYLHHSNVIAQKPIYIDEEASITLFNLRSKARKMKLKHDIGLIIIDYLQLATNPAEKGNREQVVSSLSQGIKAMAKSLSVPVIALCQLSRAVETRGGEKRPILSDLRESGAIEQDASLVIFPYRPDYGMERAKVDPELLNTCELIIAKHRDGDLKDIALDTDLSTQRFFEPGLTIGDLPF